MELKNFIYIKDDFLPLPVLSSLIKYINTQDKKFKNAKIFAESQDTVVQDETRKVKDFTLNRNSNSKTEIHWCSFLIRFFVDLCREYENKLNVKTSLKDLTEITILKYEDKGHYQFHTDHCSGAPRTLSIIFLLNNDYEGGDLIFRDPQIENLILKIEKKPNRVIVWPSNFLYPHKVTPVTKGVRYSIVSWAL